jgi:hypothetical protein
MEGPGSDDTTVTFDVAKDGNRGFRVASNTELRLVRTLEMRDAKISREIVFDGGLPL